MVWSNVFKAMVENELVLTVGWIVFGIMMIIGIAFDWHLYNLVVPSIWLGVLTIGIK